MCIVVFLTIYIYTNNLFLLSLQFFALTALVTSRTAVALHYLAVITCIIIYRFQGSHFLIKNLNTYINMYGG